MKLRLLFAVLAVAAAGQAGALDYRSTARAAVLYDAPSTVAGKLAVAGAGLPLEVIVETDQWVKVRSHTGELAWIERAALGGPRQVMVKPESSAIRQQPHPDAGIVFRAARGVLLEATGDPNSFGWIPVKHASGQRGWLAAHEAWGR